MLWCAAACHEEARPSASGSTTAAGAAGSSVAQARPRARANPAAADGGAGSAAVGGAAGLDAAVRGDGSAAAGGTHVTNADADAGAAGTSGSAPLESQIERGPYFVSGAWHGYFWHATHGAGTTISATNFSVQQFNAPVCIKGMVVPTSDSTGNAILGVNLSQAQTDDMALQTVAPTMDGIQLDVSNRAGSEVRVQIQALDGDTNERARWCAIVKGAGGFIPWASFNSACWDGSGVAYQREPISGAMVLVPGTTDQPVSYEVCMNGLKEARAPSDSAPAAGGGN